MEWIAKRAAIEEAMIISADPVRIWPGFQIQESKEDVDEEGSEEDVDSKDEELDEIDEETMLSAGGGEGESQEEEEGTADLIISRIMKVDVILIRYGVIV